MKNEAGIQNQILRSRLLMAQNEIAHKDSLLKVCVSREQYDAKCAECDMNAVLLKSAEEGKVTAEKGWSECKAKLSEALKRIEALEKESADKDGMISRLKRKKFEPSSEILDDMDDDDIKLPENRLEVLACVAGLAREAEKEARKGTNGLDKESGKKPGRGKDRKKRKARTASSRKIGRPVQSDITPNMYMAYCPRPQGFSCCYMMKDRGGMRFRRG